VHTLLVEIIRRLMPHVTGITDERRAEMFRLLDELEHPSEPAAPADPAPANPSPEGVQQ
jgi:hypothetical protein